MEAPEISERTDLSLAEAKAEYRHLVWQLNNGPEHGWARWLNTKIEDRLTFLRNIITDYVCFKE